MWKCCKQIKTVRRKEEDRGKRSFLKNKIKNREKKNYLQRTHFPWSRWRQHFQRRKHNIRGATTLFPWSRWRQHFQRRKHNIRGATTTTTVVVYEQRQCWMSKSTSKKCEPTDSTRVFYASQGPGQFCHLVAIHSLT